MTQTDQIILDALRFERDHWSSQLDSRRSGWRRKNNPMREWAAKRVGELQEIINRMEPFEGVTTASHAAAPASADRTLTECEPPFALRTSRELIGAHPRGLSRVTE